VRTYEVDYQGIVHNSNYLRYFEDGRIEYRRNLNSTLTSSGFFTDGIKIVVVHNSIDYFSPSYLDEELEIFTRISWIKNSSFCFENIIIVRDKLICNGKGILVNINYDDIPENLPELAIKQIKEFEGDNLEIRQ